MSSDSPFIGLPISAELSNGSVIEGIIHRIDPSTGKLDLTQARFLNYDGTFSESKTHFILDKDTVKDLTLLSTTRQPTSSSPSPPPNYNHSKLDNKAHHSFSGDQSTSSSSTPSKKSNNQRLLTNSNNNGLANLSLNDDHHHQHQRSIKPPSNQKKKRRSQAQKHHNHSDRQKLRNSTNAHDSGFSGHEDTDDGIPTPEPSPSAQHEPDSRTPKIVPSDFTQDFDFQAGLMAFDKAKLWAEIASTDSTDPNDRLIAHNRKKINGSNFDQATSTDGYASNRKLGPTEMVLTAQEQATNGSSVSKPWLQSSDLMKRDPYLLSNDGYPIHPVSLDRLNQALSFASVEGGPSLIQRTENASRSMTDYVIQLLHQSHPSSKSYKNLSISILVGSHGSKASCAIRTATLLANKGFKVVLFCDTSHRPSAKARNDAFDFQLRLFGSTGAVFAPHVEALPSSPALIIEALAENSITSIDNPNTINHALIAYTHRAPTLSIDTASYLNYDTGEPLAGPSYVPGHQHLVCLGAVPKGVMKSEARGQEICLIDLTLNDACWQDSNDDDQQGSHHPGSSSSTPLVNPWGDGWFTILKIS